MNHKGMSSTRTRFPASESWTVLYIVIFLLVCSLPLVGTMIGFESPNLEKRALAQAPAFKVDGRVNLNWTRNFDDYYADRFAFRSYLVSAYHQLNLKILNQSGSEKVIAGKSGWLFFGESLPDYLASPVLTDRQLQRLAVTLSIQQEYLMGQGIDFYFVVAPNKNSLYGQYMPKRYSPVNPASNLDRWLEKAGQSRVHTIDLLTPLKQAVDSSQTSLYHLTDTHWNNLGALYGFQTIMADLSEGTLIYDDFQQVPYTARMDWQGDLASMLFPSGVTLEGQQYLDIPQRYRTVRPMRSLEDILIQTSLIASPSLTSDLGNITSDPAQSSQSINVNRTASSIRLWMFRDSFANALIPFFANTFEAVTFSREVPFNYTSISKENADIVILEIVERNLPQLLRRAPIVPAPERPEPSPLMSVETTPANAGDSAVPDSIKLDVLLAGKTGSWLKIAGLLAGNPVDMDLIDTIYLGIEDAKGQRRYLEATPIDETDQDERYPVQGTVIYSDENALEAFSGKAAKTGKAEKLGLTAYMRANEWRSGSQIVAVYYRLNNKWNYREAQIDLP